jgi:hypothetical protein
MTTGEKSTAKQLDDITECPICSELFKDPRSLPCIHTYCMKCIEVYGVEKKSGDTLSCPVCRKDFIIPAGGLIMLPKNFFMEKLLSIKQVTDSRSESLMCEVCEAAGRTDLSKTRAVVYCVECQEKLCDDCASVHKNSKLSRSHRQVRLVDGEVTKIEEMVRTSSSTACEKHKDQTLNVFCRECKTAICVICYIASHKQHDCTDISDVVDEFRQQMTTDVTSLAEGVAKLGEMLASVEQQKEKFVEEIAETEDAIVHKAEEAKQRIEHDKQTLLSELETRKSEILKQLNHLSHEVTQQMSLMENLKKYTEELVKKGAAGDIARETSMLQNRAKELLELDVLERSRNNMYSIDVNFTASTSDVDNMVGKAGVHIVAKGGFNNRRIFYVIFNCLM